MKSFTLFLAAVLCVVAMSVVAQGQILTFDSFSYPPGQLTTVSGGAWVNFSGTGNFIQVTSPGLTYTNYPNFGNKIDIVSVSTSAEDVYRQFATQTTGTTYAAFLVNVTNTTGLALNSSANGDLFAGFLPSSSTTNFADRVSIRLGVTAGTYQLGLRASGVAGNTAVFSTDMTTGTTNLVVISYQIVAGATNDVTKMWINPSLGISEPPATLSQTSASDNPDVARFFVRQGTTTTPNASIDGLRVGTTWESVTYIANAANVGFDSASQAASPGCAATTLSWPHTIGNSTQRLLIVAVSVEGAFASNGASTVQYGSSSLTLIGGHDSSVFSNHAELWQLVNPPAGTQNITVTLANGGCIVGGGTSYFNVDQTTPISSSTGADDSAGANPSVTVTSATNEVVVDVIAAEAAGASPGASQTTRWGPTVVGALMTGAGSTKAGASSVNMSWTLTSCGCGAEWSQFAASIKPQATTAADSTISGRIVASDGTTLSGATVLLSGTQNRKTISDANGNYRFDNVETAGFYTVTASRVNYSFSPQERSFSQLGNHTEVAFIATPLSLAINPVDTAEYFVRQHYVDFLGREPDEAGFNFWSDQIIGCGDDTTCAEQKRINVSAAYFQSIEFQETRGLVDGLYRASFNRRPGYAEFIPDTASVARDVVVGADDWQRRLATNKQTFLDAFVQRPDFQSVYGGLSNNQYVETLLTHTRTIYTQGERDALVSGLTSGELTRSGVLGQIAGDPRFVAVKRNEMFVMMEYFGYLRRDPDEAGYQFWLTKLNQFNGNFEQAEMVKAFIVSGEYRARFH